MELKELYEAAEKNTLLFSFITFEDGSEYYEAGHITSDTLKDTTAYADMLANNADYDNIGDLEESIKCQITCYELGSGEEAFATNDMLDVIRENYSDVCEKAHIKTGEEFYADLYKSVGEILFQLTEKYDGKRGSTVDFFPLPESTVPIARIFGVCHYDTFSAVTHIMLADKVWREAVDAAVEYNRRGADSDSIIMLRLNTIDENGIKSEKEITPHEFAEMEHFLQSEPQKMMAAIKAYNDIVKNEAEKSKPPDQRLREKFSFEYDEFIAEMKTRSPDEIIEAAYEIDAKRNINTYIQTDAEFIDDWIIQELLSKPYILDELYNDWLKNGEWNSYEDISYLVEDTAKHIQRIYERDHKCLSKHSKDVEFEGIDGMWNVIKSAVIDDKSFFLLENASPWKRQSGNILADGERNIIAQNVHSGFVELPVTDRRNVTFSVEQNGEIGIWQNNDMTVQKMLFECVLSDRPYKYAMDNGEGISELRFAQISQSEKDIAIAVNVDEQTVDVFGGDSIYTSVQYTFDEIRAAAKERGLVAHSDQSKEKVNAALASISSWTGDVMQAYENNGKSKGQVK